MITGKDIIVNGHQAAVKAQMDQMSHEDLIIEVVRALVNHEVPDMVVGYDAEDNEFFHPLYNHNFIQFYNSLTDEEKIWFLLEFKAELSEYEAARKAADPDYQKTNRHLYSKNLVTRPYYDPVLETLEDRFVTNRIVFNGGLEEIFMSGKAMNAPKDWDAKRKLRGKNNDALDLNVTFSTEQ